MSQVYFVRHLGKIRGPFAPDHVGRLVAAGLIGPAAEVSTDRAGWYTLAAHPGFGGVPEPTPPDDYELDLSAGLPSVLPADGTGSEWFDSVDLGTMGDV